MASDSGPDLLFSAENINNSHLSTALFWTVTPQMFSASFEWNYAQWRSQGAVGAVAPPPLGRLAKKFDVLFTQ
jgi:hypothetical protein